MRIISSRIVRAGADLLQLGARERRVDRQRHRSCLRELGRVAEEVDAAPAGTVHEDDAGGSLDADGGEATTMPDTLAASIVETTAEWMASP